MTPIEAIAAEMKRMPAELREQIILRFVARQRNAELLHQIERETKNRIALLLIQRGYKPREVGF